MRLFSIVTILLILAGCAATIGYKTYQNPKLGEKIETKVIKSNETNKTEPLTNKPTSSNVTTYYERYQQNNILAKSRDGIAPKANTTLNSNITSNSIKVKQEPNDVITNLFNASLAFAIRDRANINEDIKAQLLIDAKKEITQLEKELTVEGNSITKQIQVSKIIIAKLVAPDFEVTAITPEEQLLSLNSTTEWLWILNPKSHGIFEVNLSVIAILNVNGRESKHHLKTFDKTIVIEISQKQILQQWLNKNWQWITSTLIIPLVIFLFKDTIIDLIKRLKKQNP